MDSEKSECSATAIPPSNLMNYYKIPINKKITGRKEKGLINFQDVMENYNLIKGKRKADFPFPFWDVVALTTSTEVQKCCVEQQIDEKLVNKELPIDIPYVVISDPPGCRIGSGGSNFQILQELVYLFGERLFTLRVLLILTGGQSQRLPSHSCLGKLFGMFPSSHLESISTILDVKLALYHPFVARMKPGVFVTSSDDIEPYCLNGLAGDWSFENEGFTLLAHPSPISIGLTHGVYVLPNNSSAPMDKLSFMSPCFRVLQKPSYQTMKDSGAVFKKSNGEKEELEYVYTDSAYFFTHSISRLLLDSIESVLPYQCDLDAYRDFLQPLGSNPTKTYFSTRTKSPLFRAQKALYNVLKDAQVNVLVLNKSAFYHLGTMEEYVDNLTMNEQFIEATGLTNWSNSVFASPNHDNEIPDSVLGVVMNSVVHAESKIGKAVVVEGCNFESPIKINRGIISHCQLLKDENGLTELPNDMLWHTTAVNSRKTTKYVTVVFHINDDIKETFSKSECHKLKFLRKELKEVSSLLMIKKSEFLFETDIMKMSLWELQMFPVRSTREDSLKATLALVNQLVKQSNHDLVKSWLTTPRMSMKDIMDVKNIDKMLECQNQLLRKLQS